MLMTQDHLQIFRFETNIPIFQRYKSRACNISEGHEYDPTEWMASFQRAQQLG
jgi:hypothetical protein